MPAADRARASHDGATEDVPAASVRAYLAAMEARDLEAARSRLAPGFAMTFPGGVRFETLEELVAWAGPRYRFVTKTFERVETVPGTPAVVWCVGTLAGEWPDGTAFEGIRFVDRFEVAGGLLLRQDVWNDLAEVRGGRA